MKASVIRSRFLNWFEERGHTQVPSAPLVPRNDPSLFFTNAGMVQFKDVFTGAEKRSDVRATSVQKCLRVSGKHNDLENVGRTPRHHTFFEMLGNFSFGDYFKAEAIPFAWELLTGAFALNPDRLWVTIYEEDDEAFDLWRSKVNFPAERIQRLGVKDNFWSMGDTGPCGPCTEIHWDHGPSISSDERGPAFGSDRYVEIWNLVFMQYDQSASGRVALPRPSIDTGMGLERLAAVVQGVYSNYDTDLFQGLIHTGARLANVHYGESAEVDVALKVMADHSRATAFLIADGVMPSNEGRGYVLRRIMRRAIRFGVKIGLDRPFFSEVTQKVVDDFGEAYPELAARQRFVAEVVGAEEERFRRTLDRGTKLLQSAIEKAGPGGTLPGEVAFQLSDTYGFPLDLTELIAAEHQVGVDAPGYDAALAGQKAKGRAAWKGSGEQSVGELWHRLAEEHGSTVFAGYTTTEQSAEIVALVARDAAGALERVERLEAGQHGVVLLDRTPLYGESGGQVGDTGSLLAAEGRASVGDTTKTSGLHLHHVQVTEGHLQVGQGVAAVADDRRRNHTRRNHTATHLLHAALHRVLGDHVNQKGSLVSPDRLRFDFSHHKAMTAEEVLAVESMVNEQVLANTEVLTTIQGLEEARAAGAMALFGEKYEDEVRVVQIPGFSLELCGGTHVGRTGDIGQFRVVMEQGIAAGVRRIEAVTGHGALQVVRDHEALLAQLAAALKSDASRLLPTLLKLKDEKRAAEKRIDQLEAELASGAGKDALEGAREVGGVRVIATRLNGDLKKQADVLRTRLGSGVMVLGSDQEGKVVLLVSASSDLVDRVHAGKVISEVAPMIGGRGGGKPELAQAGGNDAGGLDGAMARAVELIAQQLGASA